jgi:sister-chromatid-cohesion protein PDS5
LVPDAFEHRSDVIMPFLLQNVLTVPEASDLVDCILTFVHESAFSKLIQEAMESEEEWFEDDVVPPSLVARIQTLKVCRNRCLALSSTESALDKASPVMRMLFTLLEYGGTLNGEMVDEYVAMFQLSDCNVERSL